MPKAVTDTKTAVVDCKRFFMSAILSSIAIIIFSWSAMADGFRPDSDLAADFLADLNSAEIVVFPTVVRDPYISRYSAASRDLMIEFLNSKGLGTATAGNLRFDLGKPQDGSQFDMFQGSMRAIADHLGSSSRQADYFVVLEILFAPTIDKVTQVFGIHVYILTPGGDNAFSFLLNAHHGSFSDATLRTSKGTAEDKEELAIRSTRVVMQALVEQISEARQCIARTSDKLPTTRQVGVLDDFESGLPGGTDEYGVPLGFSTFHGKRSSAAISTTTEYPPLPLDSDGNAVLKLDLDVDTWAGVLHSFENDEVDQWVSRDWRGARELSFWIYGNNSGTALVVDVLDNRNRCSTVDDAERYSYRFVDNFSGWKLFAIPFEVMLRKEIGNDAPNDGLGLSTVHGWGFASLRTDGEVTYFIDEVSLREKPLLEDVPEGLSRERDVWVPINELPMFGEYEKTAWQREADEEFFRMVLPDIDGDREAAAERFARLGWNFYYDGDKSSAIKRLNQAWLLNPENQNALWGFAVISRERGKMESAIRFYDMALDEGPENQMLLEEYERARRTIDETQSSTTSLPRF